MKKKRKLEIDLVWRRNLSLKKEPSQKTREEEWRTRSTLSFFNPSKLRALSPPICASWYQETSVNKNDFPELQTQTLQLISDHWSQLREREERERDVAVGRGSSLRKESKRWGLSTPRVCPIYIPHFPLSLSLMMHRQSNLHYARRPKCGAILDPD